MSNISWSEKSDWDNSQSENNVQHDGSDLKLYRQYFYDDFDSGSLSSSWTKFGTSNGNISVSGSEVTIEQTAGGNSNINIIGMYLDEMFPVGSTLKVRSKNTAGRHCAVIGLSEEANQPFPHGTGGDFDNEGAVSLYSRADAVSANTSYEDESGNTGYGSPSTQDYTSYRNLRMERPDGATVEIYADGTLQNTLSMGTGDFDSGKGPYFAIDGYSGGGATIVVDSVEIYTDYSSSGSLTTSKKLS